jgi:branched-chain amino acid transport system permease protein
MIVLLSGISLGSIYGLVALTFTSIYNASKVINFAQGEFVMLGALGAFFFMGKLHFPIVPTFLLTIALVSLVGLIIQRLMVNPLMARKAPDFTLVLGTLSTGLIISGTVGVATEYAWLRIDPLMGSLPVHLFGVPAMPQNLLIIGATVLLVVAYWFFLNKTIVGMALKATGADRDMASLVGIRSSMMVGLAFVISAAMSAIAGILVAPIAHASATMGLPLVIKGFIACIFGGLGNPFAAVLGGLVLGIIGAFLTGYYSSVYAEIITLAILLLILIPKPEGLFGERV